MTQVLEVGVHVCPMETPSDISALTRLLDAGAIDARDVIAVVGKTEGTGLGKDIGRETADAAVRGELGRRLGLSSEQVGERICVILSGGSPGVLTPHVTLFTRRSVTPQVSAPQDRSGRLAIGRASSEEILPEEIGRTPHVNKVAAAVAEALREAGIADPRDAHAVLVKGPALTEEGIEAARSRGHEPVTLDLSIGPEGAMCYSNDASALGVAVATGEVAEGSITDAVIRRDFSLFSDIAITSAAGEKTHAEVVVLGNRADASGNLRIGHRSMRSIVDLEAVSDALHNAGLEATQTLDDAHRERVVYLMGKMIIPGEARLHGNRITLHDDPLAYHVAKAMGGYLFALVTGKTAVFVSGGERNSHQGPPNGNPLAAIVRIDAAQ